MPLDLFDYVTAHGSNDFAEWTRDLQKVSRAKLNAKIDMLALHGEGLVPHVLTDTPVAGIRKLRVKGNVQLRPLLCRGPINGDSEYTFLMGATERDGQLVPDTAPETADVRRATVANDGRRRCKHERII
ncbi:hypothetical protein [Burkholderia metallica]|uniref:hypothetical protein n=1 Tax=Burkholderia metallica TaxID=488729 RepID=UPI00158F56C3|nr:hypothetical protein [Burkholderia metallica]